MTAGWNAGTFTRGNGVYEGDDVWENDKNEPVAILASRHDAHDKILADGINACVNKDGSNAANVVATAWLQNSAVTTAKIADSNVTTAKIADEAVTEAKLADDAASRSTLLATFTRNIPTSALSSTMYVPDTVYYNDTAMTAVGVMNSIVVPKALKVTHLTLNLTSVMGTSNTLTATLRKNGSTTGQSVAVTGNSNTTNYAAITAQSFSAGDAISIAVASNAATSTPFAFLQVWGHFTA